MTKPATVLIVEDDPDLNSAYQLILSSAGYTILCAENGKQALEVIKKSGDPDIILLDLRMPVMDGMSATREIRQQMKTGNKPLPIIAMTAVTLPETVDEIMRSGMNDHIAKPVNLAALRKTLAHWLDRS